MMEDELNRGIESRLRKLEAEHQEKAVHIIWVDNQADADRKLAEYKGKEEPMLVHWQW